MKRVIWQYWETRGKKPAFVDGLHRLAQRNSGCEVVQVTPQTLAQYLPEMPRDIEKIGEMAHKADMLRAMLVARYGGMWLDSDAIVLQDLNWMFDLLEHHEFVGFNDAAQLSAAKPWMRINCFLSRPGGVIATEWVRQQHAKFPRTQFEWEEIGTELLHPICLTHSALVHVLPFETICPIPWNRVEEFERPAQDAAAVVQGCSMVMLSNASLKQRAPQLRRQSCHDIAAGDALVSGIMRLALRGKPVDGPAPPESTWRQALDRISELAGRLRRQR